MSISVRKKKTMKKSLTLYLPITANTQATLNSFEFVVCLFQLSKTFWNSLHFFKANSSCSLRFKNTKVTKQQMQTAIHLFSIIKIYFPIVLRFKHETFNSCMLSEAHMNHNFQYLYLEGGMYSVGR